MKHVLSAVAAVAAVFTLTFGVLCAADAPATGPAKAKAPQHWIHWMGNFATDAGLKDAMDIMKRGAASGYTGFVACDSKFEKYHLQPKSWVDNVKKFRQACKDNKIDFVAPCAPFGYSAEFLTIDPNLVEGYPVKDAPYVVKSGKLVPDDDVQLKNGSFEETSGTEPKAWQITSPGKISFVDSEVKHDGKVSVRIENPGDDKGAGRIGQRIKVRPFQYYHLSAWIKTEKFDGKDLRMGALGGENTQWCTWAPPPIEQDMDWTLINATFNTLDNTEVTVYIGTWGGKKGKMWIDDVKLEPAGFVNLIRRESAPLKVTSEDGKTTFVEGKDFSKIVDPELLNDGNKPGYFTTWHNVPAVTAVAGGALKDGTKLKISYEHFLSGSKPQQVTACMSEPKVYEAFEKQIKFMTDNFQPDAFFMQYDEIRQGGWDNACASRNMTCGQIAGESAAKCSAIIAKVSPGKPAFVWNDIFDPNHNAKKTEKDGTPFVMYMVKGKGPWYGSWETLPKAVGIINWNNGSNESVAFFSEQSHQQILSSSNPDQISKWLTESGQKPGVVGVMYTNWNHDYKLLEKYIEAVKAWEAKNQYK